MNVSAPKPEGTNEPIEEGDPLGSSKKCRACKSTMPSDANHCLACGSAQDWRRFLTFSGSILALLVSLVSVLTFALPIWTNAFADPRPGPQISYIFWQDGQITVAISNSGSAPYVLAGVEVSVEPPTRNFQSRLLFDPAQLQDQQRVIQPKEIRVLRFNIEGGRPQDYQAANAYVRAGLKPPNDGKYCALELQYYDATGAFGERTTELDQPLCSPLLRRFERYSRAIAQRANLPPLELTESGNLKAPDGQIVTVD